ncbi:MAG: hypothetical protein ACREV9_05590 [Burkholderiales bacterium]
MTLRLINDVVKPWEELNTLLVQRFAFQPDLSDVTRLASALAVSIKHQADLRGASRSSVDKASGANRIMSDVADAAKHGRQLDNPSRNNTLYVASCFEYAAGRGFRFIRNSITVSHVSYGEVDFMATALEAAQYWIRVLGFSLNRNLAVFEGPDEFFPTAYLYFNPKYCINMSQTRLKFFEKQNDRNYRPFDPPEVRFEVFEIPEEGNLTLGGTDRQRPVGRSPQR